MEAHLGAALPMTIFVAVDGVTVQALCSSRQIASYTSRL